MEWLQIIGVLVAGAVGGIAIWDRVQKHRTRIVGELEIVIFPADQPGENPWDPPIDAPDLVEGILVRAKVHNNTDAPLIPKQWLITGPRLIDGPPYVHEEIIPPKQTAMLSTTFVPDWEHWDQQLEAGLTSRAVPIIRCTLVALSRSYGRPLNLVGQKYDIEDETVRRNAAKAKLLRMGAQK